MFSIKKNWVKALGGILGIICGLLIATQTPPTGLSIQSMWGLGIVAWAIIYWIFNVLPEYVVALLMCSAWVVFNVVPFNIAFEQFSSTTWWLLLSALGIGAAVNGSGLIKRLTLHLMSFFPTTYKGQILGMLLTGMGIAPLIPSVTAKAAIMAPLSLIISDTMGYKRKSPGAAGMFSAMYAGFICTGPIFLSASINCYMARGFLPIDVQIQFTWVEWLLCTMPWGIVLLAGSYFALILLYKPLKTNLANDFCKKQLIELGSISRNEKITLIVLISTLLLWMSEGVHGISSTLVALIAWSVLLGFNVYGRYDFRKEIPWDSIIFIGVIFNLGSVLPYLNIDKWIGDTIGYIIIPVMANPYLLILVLTITIYIARFILVSMAATITIFLAVLVPFAIQAGINPWIIAFIILTSINIWLAHYQNSTYLTAYYATDGVMVKHSQMAKMSLIYMLLSLLGLFLSIPYWKLLGLI